MRRHLRVGELQHRQPSDKTSDRPPNHRHDPPLCSGERLQQITSKQPGALFEMSRLVDLGKVVLFGPRGVPNLDEKRFCQVNEFVKVVVGKKIRVRGLKVFIANPVLFKVSIIKYQKLVSLPSETIFSPPPNSPTSNSSSIS